MTASVTDPLPLATAADLQRRYPTLCEDVDPELLDEMMVEATDAIESMVGRRLAPFTGHVYEGRLFGIDPQEYGADSNTPLPFQGSLGLSFANALGGANDLVRHFWLDQFAPFHPELWTYNITSLTLTLTYGNSQPIPPDNGWVINGPSVTDGHGWLRLGTFAPEGTRIKCVYDGGYTGGIPPALKRACVFQAACYLIAEAEPQTRQGLNSERLEADIVRLLAPWARA